MPNMPNCVKCHHEVLEAAVYCDNCGIKISPSLIDEWSNVYINVNGLNVNTRPLTWQISKQFGADAYHSGRYYEAIEYYSEALKFENEDNKEVSDLYNELGISYGQLKQYDKAILYLNLAISSNPSNYAAYQSRAFALCAYGKEREAINDFMVLSENSKMTPQLWHSLGIVFENLYELEKARLCYQEALSGGWLVASNDLNDVLRKINSQK
jgi:tetratricopeptide (TPR) repeat protein